MTEILSKNSTILHLIKVYLRKLYLRNKHLIQYKELYIDYTNNMLEIPTLLSKEIIAELNDYIEDITGNQASLTIILHR